MTHDMINEKRIRAAFHSINGIGSMKLRQLISIFGSATKAWQMLQEPKSNLYKETWISSITKVINSVDPLTIEERLYQKGIKVIIPEENEYPFLLRELPDAPPILYYRGQLRSNSETLSIVGSRKATPYGRSVAESLAKEMARQGIIVVSGLARGIDTAGHKGALKGAGITWAVLGSGLDFIYPKENQKLAEEIMERGALISEFRPETHPQPPLFPMRNRLISGMSRGVVVVEAAIKSGALITVDFALEQGREVFAVPGPVFSEQSKGTNNLIRQGAKLVEDLSDIIPEITALHAKLGTMEKESKQKKSEKTKQATDPEHVKVLELLCDIPIHIDELTLNSKLPAEQVPLMLLELQLAGRIEQLPGQYYVLAHSC